ncbi:hypothetical protein LINBF2_13040 [Limnohabitans sp. INBF002]|nr:hypothetical protein LINBF2_13040 [Limnohabitans sp. INBF002]
MPTLSQPEVLLVPFKATALNVADAPLVSVTVTCPAPLTLALPAPVLSKSTTPLLGNMYLASVTL